MNFYAARIFCNRTLSKKKRRKKCMYFLAFLAAFFPNFT